MTENTTTVPEEAKPENEGKNVTVALENASMHRGWINSKFFKILLGTAGCSILTTLQLAFPIAVVVVAAIHLDDCRASQHMPIWLMQYGVMMLGQTCASLTWKDKFYSFKNQEKEMDIYWSLRVLLCWWPLIGAILVFKIDPPEFTDTTSIKYCHEALFHFSYYIAIFGIIGLILLALRKLYEFCKMCMGKFKDKDENNKIPDVEEGDDV